MVELLWHGFLRRSVKIIHAVYVSNCWHCVIIFSLLFINAESLGYASVAPWYICDGNIKGYRPVVNAGNTAITKNINDDINEYYYRQISYFNELPLKAQVRFDYVVSYEDDSFVSILIYGSSKVSTMHGLVYDKSTGNRCYLNYFVHLDRDSLKSISFSSFYQMEINGWKRDVSSISMQKKYCSGLEYVAGNDFILLGEGSIAVICSAPYDYQSVDILKLDQGQIVYLNWLNGKR